MTLFPFIFFCVILFRFCPISVAFTGAGGFSFFSSFVLSFDSSSILLRSATYVCSIFDIPPPRPHFFAFSVVLRLFFMDLFLRYV